MTYDESTVQLIREMLVVALKIAAPMLAAGVCVGLLISIVQSVTSVQDQTLTFVPKICVMMIVAAILIPWIVARLVEYAAELFRLV
jgi:flagellar biosynthesis protein FliQ